MKSKIILLQRLKKENWPAKGLDKYIASFDYFDKSLVVFSVTTSSISLASFATAIEALVGIESAIFSLAFSIFTGIVKK